MTKRIDVESICQAGQDLEQVHLLVWEHLDQISGQDQVRETLEDLAPLIKKLPAHAVFLLEEMGDLCLIELDDEGRALDYYRQALALDPDNRSVLQALADLLVEKDGALAALPYLEKSVEKGEAWVEQEVRDALMHDDLLMAATELYEHSLAVLRLVELRGDAGLIPQAASTLGQALRWLHQAEEVRRSCDALPLAADPELQAGDDALMEQIDLMRHEALEKAESLAKRLGLSDQLSALRPGRIKEV